MIIWAVIATILAGALAVLLLLYRRQVKMTCRQLAFLKKHQTNLRMGASLPFPELNELADGINEILDRSREIERTVHSSDRQLRETVTNLSHDIRTPLTSLDGYFQLLAQSESEEERRRYIAVIQGRIASLNELLEELFTYAKLQNEAYELPLEPVDLSKYVTDTLFSFYEELNRRDLTPDVSLCEGRLLIQANGEAVRRVLQNILKNALEHGRDCIGVTLRREGNTAVFCCANDVQDPAQIDMDSVFDRFYKADAARTHTSTGLGLSIARGLTERMGGTITAQLQGGRFTIEVVFPTVTSPER